MVYKGILEKLKDAGYTTYKLRKDKLIPEGTIQRIREGKPITTETLGVICELLNCNVEDILEYVREEKEEK